MFAVHIYLSFCGLGFSFIDSSVVNCLWFVIES